MQRALIVIYGFTAYTTFLACVVVNVGFIGGLYGKTIDSGSAETA